MQQVDGNPNLENASIITGQPVLQETPAVLIKINADIETKRHVCIHWCAFFILVTIFILTSVFMPESTKKLESIDICNQPSDQLFQNTSWVMNNYIQICADQYVNATLIRHVAPINQFILIYGYFSFSIYDAFMVNQLNYTASLFGLTEEQQSNGNLTEKLLVVRNHTITPNCDNKNKYNEDDYYYDESGDESEDEDENRRILQRDGGRDGGTDGGRDGGRDGENRPQPPPNGEVDYGFQPKICDWVVLLYLPILDYHDYLFVINYSNPYQYGEYFYQPHLTTYVETVDQRYSRSLLALRYTFFAFSIVCGLIFGWKIKALNYQNWVIEQKFVAMLSFLLPWFNDPIYAATLLTPNRVSAIIGVIFFSNFICCLFLFWLVLYHRIVVENGSKITNAVTKPKILVCSLLWLFFVVSYSILVTQYFKDPTTSFEDLHQKAYMAFKVLSFLFAFAIFIYLLKYLIQFCKCYETRLWRYKLIGLFNIFFMLCLGLFILSGSFEIYNLTGTEVLISISILNLYIYYQQYLWCPSKSGLAQQHNFQVVDQQVEMMNNKDYEEFGVDDININQANVVDEKYQIEDGQVALNQ